MSLADLMSKSCLYPDKAEAQKRFGAKASWEIKTAITNPSVMAVFITTPNDQHAKYIKYALENRKHVFVEKPITARLNEALSIGPLVLGSKKKFMVGHNMRRKIAIRKIKEFIDSGKIGRVVNIYANYSKRISQSIDPSAWRYQKKRHREGPLLTVGVHLIDIFHYLLGPVESVSGVIGNISRQTTAPDSNAVLLKFKNSATAFLEANYNILSESVLNVYGTKGTLYLDGDKLRYSSSSNQNGSISKIKKIPLVVNDDFEEEIDEFFSAIDGKGRVETGYQEALNALAVIEACFQSNIKHRSIKIKNITKKYFRDK